MPRASDQASSDGSVSGLSGRSHILMRKMRVIAHLASKMNLHEQMIPMFVLPYQIVAKYVPGYSDWREQVDQSVLACYRPTRSPWEFGELLAHICIVLKHMSFSIDGL